LAQKNITTLDHPSYLLVSS